MFIFQTMEFIQKYAKVDGSDDDMSTDEEEMAEVVRNTFDDSFIDNSMKSDWGQETTSCRNCKCHQGFAGGSAGSVNVRPLWLF